MRQQTSILKERMILIKEQALILRERKQLLKEQTLIFKMQTYIPLENSIKAAADINLLDSVLQENYG